MAAPGIDERGLSVAGLLVSMLVLAVVAGGSVAALDLGGGSSTPALRLPSASGTAAGAEPAVGGVVGEAADIAAQQNLDTAADIVEQAAASSGYAGITPAAVEGAARGLAFTTGASSGDDQVSLVASPAPGDGSVTLALRSSSGTCFLVWTASAATWFGTEPGAGTCAAGALDAPPAASTPGPGKVGWQQGTFPAS